VIVLIVGRILEAVLFLVAAKTGLRLRARGTRALGTLCAAHPAPPSGRPADLLRAHQDVARDRGRGHHVERVDAGRQGARVHRDADGLIGLVPPA
jgi:hypothetical protein